VSVAASFSVFLLIAVGALVRVTGSGEGCPGWPKCFGRFVPPFTYHPGVTLEHALIEYSHRLTATVVFVLVAAVAVVAWRRYRTTPRVFRPAMLALGLWLFQAVLGGLVVKFGLPAWLVTAHLATAVVFAGVLVYTAVSAFSVDVTVRGPVDRLTRLAWGGAAATLGLIVVGGFVRGEGAGLAFVDWPLMAGRVVPYLGALRPALMFAHRVLAVMVFGFVAVVAVRGWGARTTRRPAANLAVGAAVLFVAQILIGAVNVWTRLAVGPRVAHVTVAALIFGALVATAAASRACACKWEKASEAGRSVDSVGAPVKVSR
jgi:cytochrome c oxidase assembly protein subunit 15